MWVLIRTLLKGVGAAHDTCRPRRLGHCSGGPLGGFGCRW